MNLMSRPGLVLRKCVRTTADSAAARPQHDRNGALLTRQTKGLRPAVSPKTLRYIASIQLRRPGRGASDIRGTGRYGISAASGALLGLDVGRPDHFAPLLGFVGDELAKVIGRAWKHSA